MLIESDQARQTRHACDQLRLVCKNAPIIGSLRRAVSSRLSDDAQLIELYVSEQNFVWNAIKRRRHPPAARFPLDDHYA